MSNDYENWPLVPCDPAAIPDGYEAVRVGWPVDGETSCTLNRKPHTWKLSQYPAGCVPILIIRPIKPPIELPLMIVPHGWWVYKSSQGQAYVSEEEPTKLGYGLVPRGGRSWCLPPWIAAQLPQEWHELPWDKSAVQQTEGGEG